jgi:hypothetical protein
MALFVIRDMVIRNNIGCGYRFTVARVVSTSMSGIGSKKELWPYVEELCWQGTLCSHYLSVFDALMVCASMSLAPGLWNGFELFNCEQARRASFELSLDFGIRVGEMPHQFT